MTPCLSEHRRRRAQPGSLLLCCLTSLLFLAPFDPPVRAEETASSPAYPGRVAAGQAASLSSSIDGRIEAILFVPGQNVEAGQVLFELDDDAIAARLRRARAVLDRAQAALRGAETELESQRRLRERGATAKNIFIAAEVERDSAAADVEEAKADVDLAEYDLRQTRIVAPVSGQISEAFVQVGGFIEAEGGNELARIVSLNPILVAYRVPYTQRLALLGRAKTSTASCGV